MLEYQLFLFNAAERLVNGHRTICASDFEAMIAAHHWLARYAAVEIWQLGRLVGRLPFTITGLTTHQFQPDAHNGGIGRLNWRSRTMCRTPRVNHDSLPRLRLAG